MLAQHENKDVLVSLAQKCRKGPSLANVVSIIDTYEPVIEECTSFDIIRNY